MPVGGDAVGVEVAREPVRALAGATRQAAFDGSKNMVTGLRICFWGTYDSSKPRVRILLDGLRQTGCKVQEIHVDPWHGLSDKSEIRGTAERLKLLARIILSYPLLLLRYALSRRHDAVICAYPGNLDILLLWPLAKLRGERLVIDAFLPVFDTIVWDRRMMAPRSIPARIIHAIEALSLKAADRIITDTDAHGAYFRSEFQLDSARVVTALVGAEPQVFAPSKITAAAVVSPQPTVLFYGQFIPLHGIRTIHEAARLAAGSGIRWKIIGRGQEAPLLRDLLQRVPVENLDWVEWLPYEKLCNEIASADICLGIFGTSEKAARVIPNKVFQILACGRNLITRDSPAIRELIDDSTPGVKLVPPGDAQALLAAVKSFIGKATQVERNSELLDATTPRRIGMNLAAHLSKEART